MNPIIDEIFKMSHNEMFNHECPSSRFLFLKVHEKCGNYLLLGTLDVWQGTHSFNLE